MCQPGDLGFGKGDVLLKANTYLCLTYVGDFMKSVLAMGLHTKKQASDLLSMSLSNTLV
jgi:hypothetical protein